MKKIICFLLLLSIIMSNIAIAANPNNVTTYSDQYIDEGSPTNNFDDVGYHEVQSNDGAGGNGVGLWVFNMSAVTWSEGNFSFFKDSTPDQGGSADNVTYGLFYCNTFFSEGGMTHTVWSDSARNCNQTFFASISRDEIFGAAFETKFSFIMPQQAIDDSDGFFTVILNATTKVTQQFFYLHEREDGDDVAGIIEFEIAAVDTDPPAIVQFNFTSDGQVDCTGLFPAECANTTDTTPSFVALLDEDAFCKLSDQDISYDAMTNNCTGAPSSKVFCTQDVALPIGRDTRFFLSCVDLLGNNNTAPIPAANTVNISIFKRAAGFIRTNVHKLLGNASIFFIRQSNDQLIINVTSNDTGQFEANIFDCDNYTVVGMDKFNDTRDGDADPFIEIC